MKSNKFIYLVPVYILLVSTSLIQNVLADQSAHGVNLASTGVDLTFYGAKITPLFDQTWNFINTNSNDGLGCIVTNGTGFPLTPTRNFSNNRCDINLSVTTSFSATQGYYIFANQTSVKYHNGGNDNISNNGDNWGFRYFVNVSSGMPIFDGANGAINLVSLNYTNATGSGALVFSGSTPSNGTNQYYTNGNLTINTTFSTIGGSVTTTIQLFNSTNALLNTSSGSGNYSVLFTGLTIGTYLFNASVTNTTTTAYSQNRTFIIYNTTINITLPTNNLIITRFLNVTYNFTSTSTFVNVSYFTINLTNNTGGFVGYVSSNNSKNLNYTNFNLYQENISIGLYNVTVAAIDNYGQLIFDTKVFNLTNNALLNITAKKVTTNATVNTFNINLTNNGITQSYSTSTGTVSAEIIQGLNYSVYITAVNFTSANTTILKNANTNTLNFSLYAFNSIFIRFYDELNGRLINDMPIFLDLISTIYSNNYSTSNGTMSLELLSPTTYISRYDGLGYTERFYTFTVSNDSAQSLSLYLLNQTVAANVTITIIDQNTLRLEGAIVKALKFDITTNSYQTVEIGTTDVNGQVFMDLTQGDEFYKFIIIYQGQIVKITDPSYINTNSLTVQVTVGSDVLQLFNVYNNIVTSLYFENETTNTTDFFYNDLNNLNAQFCLTIDQLRSHGANIAETGVVTDCSTGSSDVLSGTLTNVQLGDLYIAKGYYIDPTSGLDVPLEQLYIPYSDDTQINLGAEGIWIQIFLTMIFTLVGIGFPEIIPVLIPFSLIIGKVANLNQFSMVTLFSLLVVGIIITWFITSLRKS